MINNDNPIHLSFALILFLSLLLTGGIWLLDHLIWSKRRKTTNAAEPWWIEFPKSIFPVILIVFFLRSFLVEPFKIPSGSMIPTLLVGDFILVNKYTYGVRLPIINKKVLDMNEPQRGEVMVFRFPDDPSLDYIKRIIGIPGDKVEYRNKQLIINGQPIKQTPNGTFHYVEDKLNYVNTKLYLEELNNPAHTILVNPEVPPVRLRGVQQFLYRDNCVYNDNGFSCTVPAGHYFMLGDNRDSSNDSRYWGFVPEDHIVGKAFFIWWNWSDFFSFEFKRIGNAIK